MPFKTNDEQTKEWASEGGVAKAAIYELDRIQLDKMRSILDKDLEIAKRIQDQKIISPQDEKKLQILQARINKYVDKLHVSKTATDITTGGKELSALLVEFVNGKNNDSNPK